jgi:hypothetical protein
MLLVAWSADSANPSSLTTPGIGSSPSLTWVTDDWEWRLSTSPAEEGQTAIFHAVISGTSPGASTVTVTNSELQNPVKWSAVKVYVLTGHAPAAPIGVTGGGSQASGSTLSDSYTASITGGQGFMVICDWNAGAVSGWTADTDCTIEDKGILSGQISYAIVRRTAADGVLGVSTSMGISGLVTGGQYHWSYAEVISQEAALAAEGQCGYPARGTLGPPMF